MRLWYLDYLSKINHSRIPISKINRIRLSHTDNCTQFCHSRTPISKINRIRFSHTDNRTQLCHSRPPIFSEFSGCDYRTPTVVHFNWIVGYNCPFIVQPIVHRPFFYDDRMADCKNFAHRVLTLPLLINKLLTRPAAPLEIHQDLI